MRLGYLSFATTSQLDDKGLVRALAGKMKPQEWYELLNGRVFFWLTRSRLVRLLTAGAYADLEHDILEIDAAPLVYKHFEEIELAAINSGATKPMPHPRGRSTFQTIDDYPYSEWRAKRKRGERVVELTVAKGVPDIQDFVCRVVRMKGDQEIATLFER